MKRLLTLLLASGLLAGRGVSGAEILASIYPATPPASQPFQLILEAAETPNGEPDFRVLNQDFEILHRSRSLRTHSRNGEISRQISWRLTLLEQSGRANGIPPIPFGNDLSNPVPFSRQQAATPREPSPRSDSTATFARTSRPPPRQPPEAETLPDVASQPDRRAPVSAQKELDLPTWALLLAAIPGVVLLLIWWQRRRHRQSSQKTPDTTPKEGISSEGEALHQACRANDAEAAARALNQWAARRWPDSPPSSIGPLARRFAGTDVEVEIRKLGQVLYSPDEKSWQGSLLWQVIKELIIRDSRQAAKM